MQEPVTIIKSNPLLPAEDFVAMRKQGIQSIEKTGSDIWTNYNVSDPGITMLEAFAYAITDLSYRTSFDIKDLLAPEQLGSDTWKNIFYTARQIMHNNPLTADDYRKLIIDVQGVRNAWLEPSKDYEVPVWVDYNFYENRKETNCQCDDAEEKTCIGKLNLTGLSAADKATYESKWNETRTSILSQLAAINKVGEDKDDEVEDKKKKINAGVDAATKAQLLNDIKVVKKEREEYENSVKDQRNALLDQLHLVTRKVLDAKIVEFEGLYNVMVEYEEDILEEQDREAVRSVVVERLTQHRNLCEDFLSINAVEYDDFGIGASLELENHADPDTVVAQMFFVIYKYFTPSIPFYTIPQMMEKGYQADEIFEGPALHHGFIDNVDLDKTALFRDIHLSDLINQIADIPGIKAITYLHLPFNINNQNNGKKYFNQWVESLQAERKIARVQPTKSLVLCCKDRDFVTYYTGKPTDRRPDRMLKLFKDLKAAERKYKLVGHDIDFPVPTGENMDLQDYYPIVDTLPMDYGVTERAGLPGDADAKRKIQALQLKGYLLFFEQLLGGYLVQLDHLRDLFSFDDKVKHNIFTRPITEIADLQSLIIDHQNLGTNKWDQILNNFAHVLQSLVETPKQFYNSREHFLDHILARFSEDTSEYDDLSRWLTPDKVDERLIHDKINMLKDGEYYKISTNRGKAYDYSQQQIWETANVSGTERRVARLLGFGKANRDFLAITYFRSDALMETDPITKQPVQKKDKNGHLLNKVTMHDPDDKEVILITSVEVRDGCCTEELMMDILANADERKHIVFHDELKQRSRKSAGLVGNFWFEIFDGADPDTAVLLASSDIFDDKPKRDAIYKKLQKAMLHINQNEGLHLVEHILLRPKMDGILDEANNPETASLLNICLDFCDLGIGLGENTDAPTFQKRIRRIPAAKCYDQMPWILEYFKENDSVNILFQQADPEDATKSLPLKFHRYEQLTIRVQLLNEFGSERVNYEIVSNQSDNNDNPDTPRKYSFIIHGDKNVVLAQSAFIYTKQGERGQTDIDRDIDALIQYFGFQLDLYCAADPCDNSEDSYSFRATAYLPCWPKRFRDTNFRYLVEKTIQQESPAHVHINVVWIGIAEMQRFEIAYINWLLEMAHTEVPSYDKTNPLVDIINTIVPCGECEDDCSGRVT